MLIGHICCVQIKLKKRKIMKNEYCYLFNTRPVRVRNWSQEEYWENIVEMTDGSFSKVAGVCSVVISKKPNP